MATWIILVGSIRAVTGELLTYDHSHRPDQDRIKYRQGAQAGALYLASLVAALLAISSIFLPDLTVPLSILATGLPAFVAQDNNRFILSSLNWQGRGLLVDGIFIISLAAGLFMPRSPESLNVLLLIWVLSAWAAALLGTILIGFNASPKVAHNWFISQSKQSRLYFSDFFVANAVANSAVFIVAFLSGPEASGAIRGSQVLLVPILLIMRGASVALGPQMARYARSGRQQKVITITVVLTAAQVAAVLACWLVISIMPRKYIESLLGNSTTITLEIFPYAAAATLALGSATVAMLALKASGNVRWSVRFKIWTAPLTLGLVILGAHEWSAAGSQIGLAVGEVVRTIMEWIVLLTWHKRSKIPTPKREKKELVNDAKETKSVG
ncbi:hypothetical protein [Kocuria arenosa]|uniref:hypothetical protein n=1 Tax=Kocuria arenosa TaxID=3071446 RepID=UPI0036DE1E01